MAEIAGDIRKLAAHRIEVQHRCNDMIPVMIVIDTAPNEYERMTKPAIESCKEIAAHHKVTWMYTSSAEDEVIPAFLVT